MPNRTPIEEHKGEPVQPEELHRYHLMQVVPGYVCWTCGSDHGAALVLDIFSDEMWGEYYYCSGIRSDDCPVPVVTDLPPYIAQHALELLARY